MNFLKSMSQYDRRAPEYLPTDGAAATGDPLASIDTASRLILKEMSLAATNFSNSIRQFFELQQRFADHFSGIADSVDAQHPHLIKAAAELPGIKERVNWLIANYYDQGKTNEALGARIERMEGSIASLAEAIRSMSEMQTVWKGTMDQFLEVMLRIRAGAPVEAAAPPPAETAASARVTPGS